MQVRTASQWAGQKSGRCSPTAHFEKAAPADRSIQDGLDVRIAAGVCGLVFRVDAKRVHGGLVQGLGWMCDQHGSKRRQFDEIGVNFGLVLREKNSVD